MLGTSGKLVGSGSENEKESRPSPFTSDDSCNIVLLKVLIQGATPVGDTNTTMAVRIRGIVSRTYSLTALVDILSQDPTQCTPSTAFIKLYDRRCSDLMREHESAIPRTAAIEAEFIAALQGDEYIWKVLEGLREESDEEESDESHDDSDGSSMMAAMTIMTSAN